MTAPNTTPPQRRISSRAFLTLANLARRRIINVPGVSLEADSSMPPLLRLGLISPEPLHGLYESALSPDNVPELDRLAAVNRAIRAAQVAFQPYQRRRERLDNRYHQRREKAIARFDDLLTSLPGSPYITDGLVEDMRAARDTVALRATLQAAMGSLAVCYGYDITYATRWAVAAELRRRGFADKPDGSTPPEGSLATYEAAPEGLAEDEHWAADRIALLARLDPALLNDPPDADSAEDAPPTDGEMVPPRAFVDLVPDPTTRYVTAVRRRR